MPDEREDVYFLFTDIVEFERVCAVEWVTNTVLLFLEPTCNHEM
jgi:hypothetical protein